MKISYTKEYRKEQVRRSHEKVRMEAMRIVGKGKLFCSNCECTVLPLLEINHKKHNGSSERKEITGWAFYYNIVKKRRNIDDLNLLCKLCNVQYWITKKYAAKYKIVFLN